MDPVDKPRLLSGGLHVDVRGTVSFVNDFDFKGVDRFYTIRAHRSHEPRGWVGHRREAKWFTAVRGAILIGVVKPDSWESPADNLGVERFVLSGVKPAILCIPPGHATAIMALDDGAILMVYSSGTIENAGDDDYRFKIDRWPVTVWPQLCADSADQ